MAKTSEATSGRRDAIIGLRLPGEMRDALKRLAEKEDRSLSYYVVRVLADHVREKGAGKRKPSD